VNKELELWQFILERLGRGDRVMLLVVAESSGSSPGRRGYKLAVGADRKLSGSIGGGVMEVNLVEESRRLLSDESGGATLTEQVHRDGAEHASGMICSGKQTVIFKELNAGDTKTVESIIAAIIGRSGENLVVTPAAFEVQPLERDARPVFERISDTEFRYTERLGFENDLYIIGGGHCALALSELMSKMDFHISLFDDRPDLNTIEKNRFAHEIKIIEGYDRIGQYVSAGEHSYVVVMTLGYVSDGQAIRSLVGKDFKYFGVLGSNAKMATMLRELVKEGLPREMLDRIRTPVGIPINSRTPEEIAVSIAAEIISVKNSD
jgi:xanthine dehydrogenase accessory factor